jgi:recombinational DNA repair protein RecT
MKDWKQAVEAAKESLLKKGLDKDRVEKECALAAQAIQGSDRLQGCTPVSIYTAVCNVLLCGTTLSLAAKESYLVPRKGVCTLSFGYRYYTKKVYESGVALSIFGTIIYKDEAANFEYSPSERRVIKHVPIYAESEQANENREIHGVVASAILSVGGLKIDKFMPAWEVEKRRKMSEGKDSSFSPWKNWRSEMIIKTAIKFICGDLPQGKYDEQFANALEVEAAQEQHIDDREELAQTYPSLQQTANDSNDISNNDSNSASAATTATFNGDDW